MLSTINYTIFLQSFDHSFLMLMSLMWTSSQLNGTSFQIFLNMVSKIHGPLHMHNRKILWLDNGFAGFKQPLAACCGYGEPPLNFDNRIACGETKNLNGSTVTASPCNNTAEYVNWDGNHYTEAANRYISDQILSGNYSDPPLTVNRSFNYKPKFINYKMLLWLVSGFT